MSETCLISLRGLVYFLDQAREWQPQGDGYSQVSLYHDPTRDTYRVVAMSLKTKEASINSRIYKEQNLKKDNDTFFQWADAKNRYGVNFAEEDKAAEFEKHFREIIEKLAVATPKTPTGQPPAISPPSSVPPGAGPGGPAVPKRGPLPTNPGGSTITRGTPPPQFNPGAGRAQPTSPQGVGRTAPTTAPRPFQRPTPPGRTSSNGNLAQSPGSPSLNRGNLVPPVLEKPPDESSHPPPPQHAPPPSSHPSDSSDASDPSPTEEKTSPAVQPKAQPPVVSPRAGAGVRAGSGILSSSSTTPPTTPTTPTGRPSGFQPASVPSLTASGGIAGTARRGTPSVPQRGDSSRNISAEPPVSPRGDEEPVISAVSTMDLHLNDDESQPVRSRGEVDTILSPKGEVALRRKQTIDKNAALSSSTSLILVMMKEHSGLFDNRTDQVSAEVKCMVEFLEKEALETREIFAYRVISKHLLAPLLKSMRRKGAPHLPTDTDPHLVAEMLKISYEELPRRPFNFDKFEPEASYNDLKDNNARVQFIKKALATIPDPERQSVGILVSLLNKTASKSSTNGMDGETLAALFAPFLVDAKWLDHKIPPKVRLRKPFRI